MNSTVSKLERRGSGSSCSKAHCEVKSRHGKLHSEGSGEAWGGLARRNGMTKERSMIKTYLTVLR